GTISFLVGGNQSISASSSGSAPGISVNKSSGTLSVSSTDMICTSFTLAGGTFTAPSGTLTVTGNWTHTAGGTFNNNSGTVATTGAGTVTYDVMTTETFNNFTVANTNNNILSVAASDTLVVTGTLTQTDGAIGGSGVFEAQGGVTIGNNADGGTGTI